MRVDTTNNLSLFTFPSPYLYLIWLFCILVYQGLGRGPGAVEVCSVWLPGLFCMLFGCFVLMFQVSRPRKGTWSGWSVLSVVTRPVLYVIWLFCRVSGIKASEGDLERLKCAQCGYQACSVCYLVVLCCFRYQGLGRGPGVVEVCSVWLPGLFYMVFGGFVLFQVSRPRKGTWSGWSGWSVLSVVPGQFCMVFGGFVMFQVSRPRKGTWSGWSVFSVVTRPVLYVIRLFCHLVSGIKASEGDLERLKWLKCVQCGYQACSVCYYVVLSSCFRYQGLGRGPGAVEVCSVWLPGLFCMLFGCFVLMFQVSRPRKGTWSGWSVLSVVTRPVLYVIWLFCGVSGIKASEGDLERLKCAQCGYQACSVYYLVVVWCFRYQGLGRGPGAVEVCSVWLPGLFCMLFGCCVVFQVSRPRKGTWSGWSVLSVVTRPVLYVIWLLCGVSGIKASEGDLERLKCAQCGYQACSVCYLVVVWCFRYQGLRRGPGAVEVCSVWLPGLFCMLFGCCVVFQVSRPRKGTWSGWSVLSVVTRPVLCVIWWFCVVSGIKASEGDLEWLKCAQCGYQASSVCYLVVLSCFRYQGLGRGPGAVEVCSVWLPGLFCVLFGGFVLFQVSRPRKGTWSGWSVFSVVTRPVLYGIWWFCVVSGIKASEGDLERLKWLKCAQCSSRPVLYGIWWFCDVSGIKASEGDLERLKCVQCGYQACSVCYLVVLCCFRYQGLGRGPGVVEVCILFGCFVLMFQVSRPRKGTWSGWSVLSVVTRPVSPTSTRSTWPPTWTRSSSASVARSSASTSRRSTCTSR